MDDAILDVDRPMDNPHLLTLMGGALPPEMLQSVRESVFIMVCAEQLVGYIKHDRITLEQAQACRPTLIGCMIREVHAGQTVNVIHEKAVAAVWEQVKKIEEQSGE